MKTAKESDVIEATEILHDKIEALSHRCDVRYGWTVEDYDELREDSERMKFVLWGLMVTTVILLGGLGVLVVALVRGGVL